MSTTLAKGALTVLRPLTPYLPILPTPLLTLLPTAAFHYTTTSSPTPLTFFLDPLSHPLHPPLLFTLGLIPLIYILGLLSGNVSWVDRLWPFFTPACSAMILLWGMWNPAAGVYGHNLPRLVLMMALQMAWSARLLSHAAKRDFYDMTSEDYRYAQFRKITPRWLFQIVHVLVIAIAQPLLLFALSLPLHALLVLPPAELSPGPLSLSVPYSTILPFLPTRFHTAPPTTPILHVGDFLLVGLALGILTIEASADRQMYAFQTSKYASSSPKMTSQPSGGYMIQGGPKPAPFPKSHYPGFITFGLFRWTRHPNFAAEQLFWLTQALFVVVAGESSLVTRSGWIGGSVFGPCFALSLLFCASTFLTEWITQRKYPMYRSYRQLVGQFVPQETALVWLWSTLRGRRKDMEEQVFQGVDVQTGPRKR